MGDTPRIPVRVRGTLRDASFDADGTVRIVDELVSIHVADREHTTRIDRVDGVVWEAPVLTVHVGQDVIELVGHAGLQPFGAQIVSTALALPEFTRTMRGLGSRRGHPRRLTAATTTLLGQLATERYPESAPDRRALEAELLEYAERLYAALDALGETAEQVRTSGNATRLARWRDWTWAVLFE